MIKSLKEYAYDLNNILGIGSYAKVYAGFHKETNQPVAVKIIDKKKLSKKILKLSLLGSGSILS